MRENTTENAKQRNPSDKVCRYWLKGQPCPYAPKCKFLHSKNDAHRQAIARHVNTNPTACVHLVASESDYEEAEQERAFEDVLCRLVDATNPPPQEASVSEPLLVTTMGESYPLTIATSTK